MSKRDEILKKSDDALIRSYRSFGRMNDLGILYTRYSHLIYGTCLKYSKNVETAKDLSMEIFEILVNKLKKHEVSAFKSWLYMLTKNHCLMYLRQKKKLNTVRENENYEIADNSHFQLNVKLLQEDQLTHLISAIDALDHKQKLCIKLFFIEEKSYDQIAAIMSEEKKKVKSYIQNGKRNLKIKLEKNHVFDQ
ncbi:MAG: RNA polymerase sigma factor (sigma-70 family) [Patiriisocius sp.]